MSEEGQTSNVAAFSIVDDIAGERYDISHGRERRLSVHWKECGKLVVLPYCSTTDLSVLPRRDAHHLSETPRQVSLTDPNQLHSYSDFGL